MGNHFILHEVALQKLLVEGANEPDQLLNRWRDSLGTPLLTKQERYHWLVEKVKSSYPPEGSGAELTWCDACEDEINLWTYWKGRGILDPEILVVGKDWADPKSKEGAPVLENIRQGRRLFFTNMLLGYRAKGNTGTLMTSPVQDRAFFKELVNILQPRIIICLRTCIRKRGMLMRIKG